MFPLLLVENINNANLYNANVPIVVKYLKIHNV